VTWQPAPKQVLFTQYDDQLPDCDYADRFRFATGRILQLEGSCHFSLQNMISRCGRECIVILLSCMILYSIYIGASVVRTTECNRDGIPIQIPS